MTKSYKLRDLDCANCAAKMQRAIEGIEGVASASVNFMAQKLTIEADDARFEEILQRAKDAIRKIEPDCQLIV